MSGVWTATPTETTANAVDYAGVPVHMVGTNVNVPAIPQDNISRADFWDDTGKTFVSREHLSGSSREGRPNEPLSLLVHDGPKIVGTYRQSALWVDPYTTVDMTAFVGGIDWEGLGAYYTTWRVRALFTQGMAEKLYGTTEQQENTVPEAIHTGYAGDFNFSGLTDFLRNLTGLPEGPWIRSPWDLGDQYFELLYQIEVGFGTTLQGIPQQAEWRETEATYLWPAWNGGYQDDREIYRGYTYTGVDGLFPNRPGV